METRRKVAIVTGASSGIGRATAHGLLAAGYAVVLAGRRREQLEDTAKAAGQPPDRILVVPTDVSDPVAVRNLFARTKVTFGRVDLLFNNAGRNIASGPLEDVAFEDWRGVVDSILTGAFLCTQEAVRLMKAQEPRGGRIINNGSISAQVPRPHSAPYTAAKHGITGLTRSTALDGRPFDIACGQIDIGNAETSMSAGVNQGVPQADGSIAAEPLFEVRHVVDAVLYMAGLPLDANVTSLTVVATKMPFVGRG